MTALWKNVPIQTLTAVEAIQRRSSFYIGAPDQNGLLRLIKGSLCIGLDGIACGTASKVEVHLAGDGSIVVDEDGRGIPPTEHPQLKCSVMEAWLTMMGACQSGRQDPDVAARICGGTGLVVVNALSSSLTLESFWQGSAWSISFQSGKRSGDLQCLGEARRTGSTLRYTPDPKVFGDLVMDAGILRSHVERLGVTVP